MLWQRGFSLLEMAIVVLAFSFMLMGVSQLLKVQFEQGALRQTDKQLHLIRKALLGYATLTGRLPCPAADIDGVENTSFCDKEGFLPWVTLAVDGHDAWGNVLKYRIDENFASSIPLSLQTKTNLKIKNVAGNIDWTAANSSTICKKSGSIIPCSRVIAIMFSVGANKQADSRNTGGDATYAFDSYQDNFDDRLLWISTSDLVGNMMRVGKWPFL